MFWTRETPARVWDHYATAALAGLIGTLGSPGPFNHLPSEQTVSDACRLAAFAADQMVASRRRRTHPDECDKSL